MKTLLAPLAAGALTSVAGAQCGLEPYLPAQPASGGNFGLVVDVDGDLAAVVRPAKGGGDQGLVHVYDRAGTTWVETAQLEPEGDLLVEPFVAVSGELVLVQHLELLFFPTRSFRLYERIGGAWFDAASFPVPAGLTDNGWAQTGAFDGDTVVVAGQRWIVFYEEGGGSWSPVAQFEPTPSGGGPAPYVLAIDGDLAVVGARLHAAQAGKCYVYERLGGVWTAIKTLPNPSPADHQWFGEDVGVGGDTVAVRARFGASLDFRYFLYRKAVGWPTEAQLVATEGEQWIGAPRIQGDLLAIPTFPGGTGPAGTFVDLFERAPDGSWARASAIRPPLLSAASDFSSVALNGTEVLIGAGGDDTLLPNAGAFYRAEYRSDPETYCTAKTTSEGCAPRVETHGGLASGTDPTPLCVNASFVPPGVSGLFFYGTSGRASLPFLGGTLCVQPPVVRTPPISSAASVQPRPCGGLFRFDFNAWLAGASIPPGTTVDGQWWFRDPAQPDGTGAGLSNAVEVVVSS